jgi:hypothetical protein
MFSSNAFEISLLLFLASSLPYQTKTMKTVISIAMVLIGMVGVAQTMDNPVIIHSVESRKNKEWYRFDDDSTITYFSNTNRTQALAYSKILVAEFLGELKKPDSESIEDGMEIYEWEISDRKVLQLVLKEEVSLIVIIDIASEQNETDK